MYINKDYLNLPKCCPQVNNKGLYLRTQHVYFMVKKFRNTHSISRIVLILSLIISILFFTLITGCSQLSAEQEKITLGIITPLSGSLSSLGEVVVNSVNMAVEEINNNGRVNGRKIEIVFEDSESNPKKAAVAAQKLISINKVPIILEGDTSGSAASIAPLAQESKIVHLSVFSSTNALIDAGDYVFKLREEATPHAEAIVSVIKNEGVENIGVLHLKDEYCSNMVKQFEKQAAIQKLEINLIEGYEKENRDVRTQITKIKNANPNGIYVCGFYEDLGDVFKQLYELGWKGKKFSGTTFEHPLVKKNAGKEAIEGTIYSVSPLDCSKSNFCKEYEKRYNIKPDYRAAFAYDALHIIAKAIKKSKNPNDPNEIKNALQRVTYEGATGSTKFDAKGNAIKEVVIHQVKGGEWANYP